MLSLPLVEPQLDAVALRVRAQRPTRLRWRLHLPDHRDYWIPGPPLAEGAVELGASDGWFTLPIGARVPRGYLHLSLGADDGSVELGASRTRLLGPLSWRSHVEDFDASASDRRAEGWTLPQDIEEEWGDSVAFPFSYWRRDGHGWGGPPAPGIAFRVSPAQQHAPAAAVLEPWERPTVRGVHGWVSAPQSGRTTNGRFEFDQPQSLTLELPEPLDVEEVDVYLDSDLDRHLANIWYSHPPGTRAMTTLVADLDISVRSERSWTEVANVRNNHARRCRTKVARLIDGVRITARATHGTPCASIMDVRIWPR
jgi:hypothetical protein